MKENKGNTVKFRLDAKLPAGLTLVKTDDRPIDYSDAPDLSDAWFEQATRMHAVLRAYVDGHSSK